MPKDEAKKSLLKDFNSHIEPVRKVPELRVGYDAYNVLPLTTELEFSHVENIKYRPPTGGFKKFLKGI